MKKLISLIWGLILASMLFLGTATFAEPSIGAIYPTFCDPSTPDSPGIKNLEQDAQGGETQDLCIHIDNQNFEEAFMRIGFVDGLVTRDGRKACKTEAEENNNFAQYMTRDAEPFTVPAGESLTKKASITFPEDYNGVSHGCLAYFLLEKGEDTEGGMFKVLVRKVNFVDINVIWKTPKAWEVIEITQGLEFSDYDQQSPNNLTDSSKFNVSFNKEENSLSIQFVSKNIGNIDEKVSARGEISGAFGFHEAFEFDSTTIYGGNEMSFNKKIENLPFYKGKFDVTIYLSYTPTGDQGDSWEIQESFSVWMNTMNTFVIIGLGIMILIVLFFIFHKKKDKKDWNVAMPNPQNPLPTQGVQMQVPQQNMQATMQQMPQQQIPQQAPQQIPQQQVLQQQPIPQQNPQQAMPQQQIQ